MIWLLSPGQILPEIVWGWWLSTVMNVTTKVHFIFGQNRISIGWYANIAQANVTLTFEICLWYVINLLLIYIWGILEGCPEYTWEMLDIHIRYAWKLPEIDLRFAREMPLKWLRMVRYLPGICKDLPEKCLI